MAAPSIARENFSTVSAVWRMRTTLVWLKASSARAWYFRLTRLPSVRVAMMAKVTKPMPPTCTRANTTAWPKKLRSVAGSISIRPVTVTADVAVNSASNTPKGWRCATGRDSSTVPIRIRTRKLPARTAGGLACSCPVRRAWR
ncbi:hypothetical protein CDEN61S_02692 [Castellaniella denitrificans]